MLLIIFILGIVLIIVFHPARFHRFMNTLDILRSVVLVQIGGLDVCRGTDIGVVQQQLDGRENQQHIIGGRPPVLQDIQAQLTAGVDIGMEHIANELYHGRFIGILLVKLEQEAESAVLKGSI